jgi:lipopolysaccharide export system permease protein
VIARASGVSAWQFVFPSLAVAIVMGIAAVTIYNPVAANLKQRADAVEARLFSRTAAANERGVWIRQRSIDGEAAIRADAALDGGVTLVAPVIFIYDPRGRFVERINADQATLQRGYWRLDNATVLTPGYQPQTAASYLLSTNLTADQVREALGGTEKVSFWHLPTIIARLDVAGLDTTRYRLRYQSLLARPLLLAAMVVVAASVSLRFFRFGGVAPMVLSGVLAGFMLYVATQIAEDFGAAGIMAPVTAAWLPAIMGALMGSLVLLHREDG